MRLAHVVQRYGADVAGGSETLCREVAERLAERHEVTVLTTCAKDYITWRNDFPPGESELDGVAVHRFRARRRDAARFWEASQLAFSGQARPDEEAAWFRENGPYSPKLIEHLRAHADDFDCVFFWTYRYYPSFAGLPIAAERAILVPTAEEDPAVRMRSLRRLFRQPAGLFFLTEEEAAMVRRIAAAPLVNSRIIGSGVEPARPAPAEVHREQTGLGPDDDFILYLGRVDENKGCGAMFEYFQRYVDETGNPVRLVVAGKEAMPVPDHPQIRALGFVSDEVRRSLLGAARLLWMPSPFESLSLVLLEAWNHARPALVNGQCNVLRGQVRRADGGLYYDTYEQLRAATDLLLGDRATADRLGGQGLEYIERDYRWPTVMEKIEYGLANWPAARRSG